MHVSIAKNCVPQPLELPVSGILKRATWQPWQWHMNKWVCGWWISDCIGAPPVAAVCVQCQRLPASAMTPFLLPDWGAGTTYQIPYTLHPPWTRSSPDSSHIILGGCISDMCHGLCQGALVMACAVLLHRRNCRTHHHHHKHCGKHLFVNTIYKDQRCWVLAIWCIHIFILATFRYFVSIIHFSNNPQL